MLWKTTCFFFNIKQKVLFYTFQNFVAWDGDGTKAAAFMARAILSAVVCVFGVPVAYGGAQDSARTLG